MNGTRQYCPKVLRRIWNTFDSKETQQIKVGKENYTYAKAKNNLFQHNYEVSSEVVHYKINDTENTCLQVQ